MLDAVETGCAARPSLELHLERFTPITVENTGPDTGFDVVLQASGREITVAAEESVLDALLCEGVDVDFSCREGTCGTCEQTVLEGEPDHRDSVLSAEEQAEGDCMMVCVSRSRCPRLVLDL